MAVVEKCIADLLDEMAVKILLIEPGDLSVVGELLAAVEALQAHKSITEQPSLQQMARNFQATLEKIIMGDLPDSADTFERLGQCIVTMQDENRRPDKNNAVRIKNFCDYLGAIGFQVEEADFSFDAQGKNDQSVKEADPGSHEVVKESPGKPPAVDVTNSPPAATSPATPEKQAPSQSSSTDTSFLQDKDLLKGFIEEAFEHLETIETNILELEQSPDDADIINNIFRPFHTIKGVSGFLNLKNINKLAHTTENLLDEVRNGRRAMDADVIEAALSVGDYLRVMIENINDALENGPDHYQEFDISEYVERVTALTGGGKPLSAPKKEVSDTIPAGPLPEETKTDFFPDDAIPVDAQPEISDESFIDDVIPADTPPETTRIEPVPDSAVAPPPSVTEKKTVEHVQEAPPPPPASAVPQQVRKSKIGDSIKVDVEKLDSLVDAMGELVIMQSLIQQNPLVAGITDPKLARDFSQLSRIISELQNTAMTMRMVPIRQTFQKMVRLVRDLSKKTGKEVNLVMSGEDTEIDRNMVDSIYDPLVHMMRNSVDHGVQVPEARLKKGKPREGTVNLRAYQKGSNIVIEIEDDGEGLDPEKIRKIAIERGVINAGDDLSDKEIINLIMMPGFSTAEKITDVSGRGVGTDVVKKAVEKLRGKVEINSKLGKGCLFTIRLPLTLAVIEGIVVRVGTERYIISTVAILESIRPQAKQYSTIHGKGETLLVRGDLIPIIRLYEVFGVVPTCYDPCEAIVVIVEYEGQKRAFMVDELLGKQEVVIKSLGSYMKNIKGVGGGTILGDGRVGLILDLAGVYSYSNTMTHSAVA